VEAGEQSLADIWDTTLQVEPTEKKKTPKGRAKKRLQYTRRFVNVTMTGGKRKVLNPAPPPLEFLAKSMMQSAKPSREPLLMSVLFLIPCL